MHGHYDAAPQPEPAALAPATVQRMPQYLRALGDLENQGARTVSSEVLADLIGVNSSMVRKDLSLLGFTGTRGRGYPVATLASQLEEALGLTQSRSIAIVGIGHLGTALANHPGFITRSFSIGGLFDVNPAVVGTTVAGSRVRHFEDLESVVQGALPDIGVVATPPNAAQYVIDRLVTVGVRSILCFASTTVQVPPQVNLRSVDLSHELQILAFYNRSFKAGS
ncbi:redox-sensing transcriptional repressor Rex [Micrococcales bacterium 31B]|nr:redox-sensing transcriptional repressor Rex [Micrococcales bacterium 31B]